MLARKRGENDKQRTLVRLTELGRQTLENAPPLIWETFVERFTSLQKWEQMLILSVLKRLVGLVEVKSINAAPYLETR